MHGHCMRPLEQPSLLCRITFESQQVRQAHGIQQQSASAGEAKVTGGTLSGPALGLTTAPAGVDHQVPRPNFAQAFGRGGNEGSNLTFDPDSGVKMTVSEDT